MRHGNEMYFLRTWMMTPIPILPMRHGNRDVKIRTFKSRGNSDPTYEAWKHHHKRTQRTLDIEFRSYLWGMETEGDLILPPKSPVTFRSYLWGMETSFYYKRFLLLIFLFRSYLWGMETALYTTSSEWGMLIPILPMRHGNWREGNWSITESVIPILPMRHGNKNGLY